MLFDFDDIYENNEKIMQVWITPFNAGVVCYHPDTIKAIFNTNGKTISGMGWCGVVLGREEKV